MIGFIEGEIAWKDERALVIKAGGVGYVVATTPNILAQAAVGEAIALWTHLAVKEDALDLYGFRGRGELGFFRLLIGISGIGPKSALNILALADVETLARAIASGDSAYLTKVSGIGKKLAEKIVLELKEKAGEFARADAEVPESEMEALDALETLGYPLRDTREMVRVLAKSGATTQEIIRGALKQLGGK